MKKLEILSDDHPALREKCVEVDEITEEVQDLAETMFSAMIANNGIGLAANQVGENVRMITVRTKEYSGAMINPAIQDKSKKKNEIEEGCLSIPGVGVVTGVRSNTVVVKFLQLNGDVKVLKFVGLGAVVVQHEIDHLDGILMTDYEN
jgi:peptide deformylase